MFQTFCRCKAQSKHKILQVFILAPLHRQRDSPFGSQNKSPSFKIFVHREHFPLHISPFFAANVLEENLNSFSEGEMQTSHANKCVSQLIQTPQATQEYLFLRASLSFFTS